VLRIVPELERSHDLVMQIASRAGPPLTEALSPGVRALAERTGALAAVMWRQAAGAWAPATVRSHLPWPSGMRRWTSCTPA